MQELREVRQRGRRKAMHVRHAMWQVVIRQPWRVTQATSAVTAHSRVRYRAVLLLGVRRVVWACVLRCVEKVAAVCDTVLRPGGGVAGCRAERRQCAQGQWARVW